MDNEETFLNWAEQALQVDVCEVGIMCRGAGAGVWYVLRKCENGHRGLVNTCCSACGRKMAHNGPLACERCGEAKELLILAKVEGQGLKVTTFAAGLGKLSD